MHKQHQLQLEWSSGQFLGRGRVEVIVKNAVAVGYCNAIREILILEAHELELDDE